MMHDIHESPRWILGDDCAECTTRAQSIEGLNSLDPMNLYLLGVLANLGANEWPEGASNADAVAVQTLRHAARIVFASGITERAAR